MKKSKILMPLTGIAAVGAIAPMVVMTSCNKNEYKLISKATCGNVIDSWTESMTNRLGIETLYENDGTTLKESISLGIGATTTKTYDEIARSHTVFRTVKAAGQTGATGTPFILDAVGKTQIVNAAEAGTFVWYEANAVTLKVNADKMNALIAEGKEEAFEFVISYEEFEGETSVGKQDYTFSVVACPKLHDCIKATVGGTNVKQVDCEGVVGKKEVTIVNNSFALSAEAASNLTVEFADTLTLYDLSDTEISGWKGVELVFAAGEKTAVEKGVDTFGGFKGTLGQEAETSFFGQYSHFAVEDGQVFPFTFTITAEKGTYVLDSWNTSITSLIYDSTQTIGASGGIAVRANS